MKVLMAWLKKAYPNVYANLKKSYPNDTWTEDLLVLLAYLDSWNIRLNVNSFKNGSIEFCNIEIIYGDGEKSICKTLQGSRRLAYLYSLKHYVFPLFNNILISVKNKG